MSPNRSATQITRDELQMELLVRNLFVVVMLGATAFVSVCFYVLSS